MLSKYTLECIKGSLEGLSFSFPGIGTCRVGRRRICDLRVHEVTVSGQHCTLTADGEQVVLLDNKSTNGTRVNGKPVSKAVLADGDTFTIGGKCSFRITLQTEPDGAVGQDFIGNPKESAEEAEPEAREKSVRQAGSEAREKSSGREESDAKEKSAGKGNPDAKLSEQDAGDSSEDSGECRCELCGRLFPAREREEGLNICPHCMEHNADAVLRFLMADEPAGKRQKEVSAMGLPGYRCLRNLGEGSFGVVWLVEEVSTGRRMALKMMLERAVLQDLEKKKFQREMSIASQLDHPNIVALYDSGSVEERFYMLQEFCAGGSLLSFIERTYLRYAGKLPVDLSVDLELQILDALDYAHNAQVTAQSMLGTTETLHGVVHRDIHPGNIFLAGHAEPLQIKVGDWGLSKAYELAGMSGISIGDVPTGTQDFASMQQHMNFRYSGPEVDVWSAAAVMFYMLTGQPPRERGFMGLSPHGILPQVRPVRSLRPDIPPALAEALDYTLAEQPRLRVLSAAELSRMIREAVGQGF